jgi:NOL1/NOP2/sun family putative RNA methylase
MKPEMKPLFKERMSALLTAPADFAKFEEIIHISPKNFIRCNTLKIQPKELFDRLSKKWQVKQPHPEHPEIMLVETQLQPGELGNAIEHLLGYYYVQEVCSMMSVLALRPESGEIVIDLCASPGSKTTQIASKMQNHGTLIANDVKMDRISILAANMERCGITNSIVTRNDAVQLAEKLGKSGFKADKILLDAPCSGEGTLRSSAKTFLMWNPKVINRFSRMQKKLLASALKALKKDGILVYSTCTHSPEENEEVIDFALRNFPVQIETITLPLKTRPGITRWQDKTFSDEVSKCHRIYPQDNDSEGFFVAKLRLLEEVR